jgi:phage terminase large subunit
MRNEKFVKTYQDSNFAAAAAKLKYTTQMVEFLKKDLNKEWKGCKKTLFAP